MADDLDKEGHRVKQDSLGYFLDKNEKTKNAVLYKTVVPMSNRQKAPQTVCRNGRETIRRDAKRKTHICPARLQQ